MQDMMAVSSTRFEIKTSEYIVTLLTCRTGYLVLLNFAAHDVHLISNEFIFHQAGPYIYQKFRVSTHIPIERSDQ